MIKIRLWPMAVSINGNDLTLEWLEDATIRNLYRLEVVNAETGAHRAWVQCVGNNVPSKLMTATKVSGSMAVDDLLVIPENVSAFRGTDGSTAASVVLAIQ